MIKIFIFTLLLVFSSSVLAKDVLIVGVSKIKPWIYQEGGSYKGLLHERFEKLKNTAQIEIRYIPTPYKRMQKLFVAQNFDAVPDMTGSVIEKHSIVLGKLVNLNLSFIGDKESIDSLKNKSVVSKVRVCAMKNVELYLRPYVSLISVKYSTSLAKCYKLLALGRVDVVQSSLEKYNHALKKKIIEKPYSVWTFKKIRISLFGQKRLAPSFIKRIKRGLSLI